jgi:exodeoxyribonuclease V alpha subunit
MKEQLGPLRERGLLAAIDVELARALARISGETRPEVLLGAALASRQTREGHVCAELERFAGQPIVDLDGAPIGELRYPQLDAWRAALARSALVGGELGATPLVLDARGRLYLERYFEHERRLAELLGARAEFVDEPLDRAALRSGLVRLFGPTPSEPDWQRIAAELAVVRRLCVVSGGPGTGKTSTVVKILALLVENALATGRSAPRIALLAPTGKAATRLSDATARAKRSLPCRPEVVAAIPEAASTIHRELGARGLGGTRFRHDAELPLVADLVIVDECSMVDVALMRRLLEAVPRTSRLVLLGDEHQLASVEAGAVLGDVCRAAPPNRHSHALGEHVQAAFGESLPSSSRQHLPGMGDCVVRLQKSHRFSGDSAIGRLARAINSGAGDEVVEQLRAGTGVALSEPSSPRELERNLATAARTGFISYLSTDSADRALAELERFRVLCAHRRGPEGAVSVNLMIERALDEAGLFGSSGSRKRWYRGRPLLITQNDYALGLFNGDLGVVVDSPEGARAFFVTAAGPRMLSPSRLPPHETVFATSIHKSQGSEFDEVAVVLPGARSPLLTRELLYTAVTRARHGLVVHASEASIRQAVSRCIQRATGLTDALSATTARAPFSRSGSTCSK